jgi:hypothetical protein
MYSKEDILILVKEDITTLALQKIPLYKNTVRKL